MNFELKFNKKGTLVDLKRASELKEKAMEKKPRLIVDKKILDNVECYFSILY